MSESQPHVVILAGPNGAGKSTTASELLKGALHVAEFVNADVIARGLSAFDLDSVAIQAGRVMLSRIRELARRGTSFAFETTLASRTMLSWIEGFREEGYVVDLLFLWLPDADTAVRRVAERVRRGGHAVPDAAIRRRYERGLRNFFTIYRQAVDSWRMYDNSRTSGPALIATGGRINGTTVLERETWELMRKAYRG